MELAEFFVSNILNCSLEFLRTVDTLETDDILVIVLSLLVRILAVEVLEFLGELLVFNGKILFVSTGVKLAQSLEEFIQVGRESLRKAFKFDFSSTFNEHLGVNLSHLCLVDKFSIFFLE